MAVNPVTVLKAAKVSKTIWDKKEYIFMLMVGSIAALCLFCLLFVYFIFFSHYSYDIPSSGMNNVFQYLRGKSLGGNNIEKNEFAKMVSIYSLKDYSNELNMDDVYNAVKSGDEDIKNYIGEDCYIKYTETLKAYSIVLDELVDIQTNVIDVPDPYYPNQTIKKTVYDLLPNFSFPISGKCNYVNDWGYERINNGTKEGHYGTDLLCEKGTPILAALDGVVENSGWIGLGGYRLYIRTNSDLALYYCHFEKASVLKVGDIVKKGDVIAYAGNSGGFSSDTPEGTFGAGQYHLHFGIQVKIEGKNTWINPYEFLKFFENNRTVF